MNPIPVTEIAANRKEISSLAFDTVAIAAGYLAAAADQDSAAMVETIEARQLTQLRVTKENSESRPSSHWGINE
jgi:hypothetical protein